MKDLCLIYNEDKALAVMCTREPEAKVGSIEVRPIREPDPKGPASC